MCCEAKVKDSIREVVGPDMLLACLLSEWKQPLFLLLGAGRKGGSERG